MITTYPGDPCDDKKKTYTYRRRRRPVEGMTCILNCSPPHRLLSSPWKRPFHVVWTTPGPGALGLVRVTVSLARLVSVIVRCTTTLKNGNIFNGKNASFRETRKKMPISFVSNIARSFSQIFYIKSTAAMATEHIFLLINSSINSEVSINEMYTY